MANIKVHVINLELKSHDSFDSSVEAAELVEHFVKEGYKRSAIRIIEGERKDFKVVLDSCSVPNDDTISAKIETG